jgi:hypothetical protein
VVHRHPQGPQALVTWLDEKTGEPVTGLDAHRLHVRPSSIESTWQAHVDERTRAKAIRARNEDAKAALFAAFAAIGVEARVGLPWRDHAQTLTIDISAFQANALATHILGGEGADEEG